MTKDSQTTQEHVYEPCARTDGGINILKDGEVLWESPSTDTPYTPHDWENALLVCVTLSGNEKPAERALAPQASGASQAQTASLKQQAEPSDAKERGDDYLRKLAVKLAKTLCNTNVGGWAYSNNTSVEEIITTLQSVQRAEREKAEGLREALENLLPHLGTMHISNHKKISAFNAAIQALDAYEARKDSK